MLEKPSIPDESIIACVQEAFGLVVDQLTFLPLGADLNTAVYRAVTQEQKHYFLKLRSGNFKEVSVTLPQFLQRQGIEAIIPLLPATTGKLWASLMDYAVVLYPFIEGHDAFSVPLSAQQWRKFGTALKAVHTAVLPPSLVDPIPKETYSPEWRQIVKEFMQRIQHDQFEEPVAVRMATFLNEKQDEVARLVRRTEQLAKTIQKQTQENVLCHSDIHAWNLLISTDGTLYIVDWDDPILAPKERDLMFIGAGLGNMWHTPQEETLFYAGYGPTQIDQNILAYYRCERIIQDIVAHCQQIFLSDLGGSDRTQALQNIMSDFLPDRTIDIAMNTGLIHP